MKPVDAADYTIAVIGAGAMGQGIAQVAVQGGVKTLLFDARPGGAEAGREQIMKRIDRLVEKDRISADDAKAAGDRLGWVPGAPAFCREAVCSRRNQRSGVAM